MVREAKRGRTNLSNQLSPGRPIDYGYDDAILNILNEDPFASARMIAKKLGLAVSTVTSHLKNNMNMKNIYLRWVPHILNDDQKRLRVEMSKKMLDYLLRAEDKNFPYIISGDESWFVYRYDHERKWVFDNEPIDERPIKTNMCLKIMITLFIGIKGVILLDVKPKK